jgi:hypothetical protein
MSTLLYSAGLAVKYRGGVARASTNALGSPV